jgi:hypothetical protein
MCLDMHVQTKFLWLRRPVAIGDRVDDWRVCWLVGWDKCHVFFVVMVEREYEQPESLGSRYSRTPKVMDLGHT